MHWLLLYDYVDDYLERRGALRPEHLGVAEAAHERGELLMAGAVGDPPDRGVLVFIGDDPSTATTFAEADPYVRDGLVRAWEVQPWTVVIGA